MANLSQNKYAIKFAVSLILFLFFSSCQLPDAPLENDYDYLHFVTDLTVQDDKLYLGIKNERDKIFTSIDLSLLLNNTDKKQLKFNILKILNYNDPSKSYKFVDKQFYYSREYSKYKNELPIFSTDFSIGELNYIVPNNYIFNLNDKSISNLNLNFFFNATLNINNLYTSIFYSDDIYFNYKYDTTRSQKYNDYYKQAFVSYNINTGIIDTLLSNDFLKLGDEYIRNSFVLNDSIYVCRNNSFINVSNKSIFSLNELKNDYIIETFQNNKSTVLLSTLKSKIINLNSAKQYRLIDCNPTIQKEIEIDKEYGISEIYSKNNIIYFVVYYGKDGYGINGLFGYTFPEKYILFSYDLNNNTFKILFHFVGQEALKKYNMLAFNNDENMKTKQSKLWSITVDEQENVYLGCNGLFIIDKNGKLLNYFNSFDLARMCK